MIPPLGFADELRAAVADAGLADDGDAGPYQPPSAEDLADHAAMAADAPAVEPSDFAAYLFALSGRLAAERTAAGYEAARALVELMRDVRALQSSPDQPIDALTFIDRRDALTRQAL